MPCWYCGVRLKSSGPAMKTRDHVVPRSRGGTKTVDACLKCNANKRDMTLEEFRRKRGGIEFWGEKVRRQEAQKIDWIYEFNPQNPQQPKKTIIPDIGERPVYTATVDMSRVKNIYPVPAITKQQRKDQIALSGAAGQPPNLLGVKFGAFTVTKWLGKQGIGKNGRPSWEVVCHCGAKEYRTTRAVRNPSNSFDACVECRKPMGKLRDDIWKATGVETSWEDCFQQIWGDKIGQI